jgi:iron complex outermembrane receptor protein
VARILLPLFLLLAPEPAVAQDGGEAVGRVTDVAGRPLTGALVWVQGTDLQAYTNERGEYRLTFARPGPIRLRASKLGHAAARRTVTAVAGATVTSDFRLRLPNVEREEFPLR